MRLKSYFSGTVEGAMVLALREMGDEAMLVNARPAMPEMRYLGAYEVVFGVEDQPPANPVLPEVESVVAEAPLPKPVPPVKQAPQPQSRDWLAQQMEQLKEEMLRMSATLKETEAEPAEEPVETGFSVEPTVGVPGAKRALAALVGPAGCGKTTTLAKLAARCGLAARKSTYLLSTDIYRIAATDQLRTMASLMELGFSVARDAAHLDRLAGQHKAKDLVLIDTPGLSRLEMDEARGFIEWIAGHKEIDTHLVLPATMNLDDMERITAEYRCFAPRKLLFTHVEETGDCRRILSLSARTGLPISFLTQGQRIPDDIELSTRDRLMELASRKYLRKGAAA